MLDKSCTSSLQLLYSILVILLRITVHCPPRVSSYYITTTACGWQFSSTLAWGIRLVVSILLSIANLAWHPGFPRFPWLELVWSLVHKRIYAPATLPPSEAHAPKPVPRILRATQVEYHPPAITATIARPHTYVLLLPNSLPFLLFRLFHYIYKHQTHLLLCVRACGYRLRNCHSLERSIASELRGRISHLG